MQIDTQKSRLENLFFNDTIDDETVANIEKMLTRKKVEKLHKYKILYNEKEMPGTPQTRRIITSVFKEKLLVNCWMH